MDKKRSAHTSTRPKLAQGHSIAKATSRKARGDCDDSESSSHTHIFRRDKYQSVYRRITSDEFVGVLPSVSGSSDTFQCVHGPGGRPYSQERRLQKNLDPITIREFHFIRVMYKNLYQNYRKKYFVVFTCSVIRQVVLH